VPALITLAVSLAVLIPLTGRLTGLGNRDATPVAQLKASAKYLLALGVPALVLTLALNGTFHRLITEVAGTALP
jgi:hypothetical protein